MGQLVTKVLVSRESPLQSCQLWPGHNSPVPRRWESGPNRCPHPRVNCSWMIVVRTPRTKKVVAFGADEPDSSEPAKGLKEGVFQMWDKGCVCGEEEDGCREDGGKWLFCTSVLRIRFRVSVLIVKSGMKCTLVVCSIQSGYLCLGVERNELVPPERWRHTSGFRPRAPLAWTLGAEESLYIYIYVHIWEDLMIIYTAEEKRQHKHNGCLHTCNEHTLV